MEEWLALMRSGSGERGICNRHAMAAKLPKRRKDVGMWGMNPCGEIVLRPFQFCNLSIVVARPDDTEETLARKVRIATYFGVMQSTATSFRYIRPEWKKNVEEERLIGVDITGHADCPLIRDGAPGRDALLQRLKKVVHDTKVELAGRFEINESTADTTVKPSGDSSVFFDCGSGISARFAQYQWRWVRESMHSPTARFLIDQGVPYAQAPEDPSLLVFGFPRKAPEGCLLRDDQDAIQQLENWLLWKRNWAEHSVSATIYIRPEEWFRAGAWVYDHFDEITGLSFMPKDNGTYRYAPNEEMTKEQYEEVMASFPEIHWEKLCRYESEDNTESAHTLACTGGSCDL
jgi:ribonucleoside-diphosphate reductase alpha chain